MKIASKVCHLFVHLCQLKLILSNRSKIIWRENIYLPCKRFLYRKSLFKNVLTRTYYFYFVNLFSKFLLHILRQTKCIIVKKTVRLHLSSKNICEKPLSDTRKQTLGSDCTSTSLTITLWLSKELRLSVSSVGNIGINRGFQCSNIRWITRKVFEHKAAGRVFKPLPSDPANVRILKQSMVDRYSCIFALIHLKSLENNINYIKTHRKPSSTSTILFLRHVALTNDVGQNPCSNGT